MHAIRNAALVLGLLLATTGTGRAGLYNPSEPEPLSVGVTTGQFKTKLGDLRGIAAEKPAGQKDPLREHYLRRVDELKAKVTQGIATVTDRIDLSAYLLRLLKVDEAVDVLAVAEREDPDNFMVLANLATAHFMSGDPRRLNRAVEYQERVLKVWPRLVPGKWPNHTAWYRRAELYQLALLKGRQQEALRPKGNEASQLDELFPGVRFVAEDGTYRPGEMPQESRDLMPPDCGHIVGQLLLWLPHDNRLYWLFGEFLNATGEVSAAAGILDELTNSRGMANPELKAHRRILLEASEGLPLLFGEKRTVHRQILWAFAPHGMTLGLGIGNMLPELGRAATTDPLEKAENQPPELPADPPPPPGWMPDWKIVAIGFIFGMLFALLLNHQLRGAKAKAKTAAG